MTKEKTPVMDGLKSHKDTFTFKIPETHSSFNAEDDSKNRVTKEFHFKQVANDEEALMVLEEREDSLMDIVNDILKTNARSNAYQSALAAYKPSTLSLDEQIEATVRSYIRMGIPEDVARKQVTALLAAKV